MIILLKELLNSKKIYILILIFLISFILLGGTFLYFQGKNVLVSSTTGQTYNPVPIVETFEEEICENYKTIDFAFYDNKPELFEPNNKFGLYIYAERQDFFEIASKIVNSSGGEWGYVLIPYNVKDRDFKRWSRVFDDLTRLKLIPVIQLWDVTLDKYKSETIGSAKFLDRFDWPTKYRYISVYNEPNDKNFWYGKVDPEGYAEILDFTIDTFRKQNKDFRIMNGAFNVSASTNSVSLDSFEYKKRMNKKVPGIFNKLDAWASHSYPQPNFSGDPLDTGRWSIRAYEKELEFLRQELGVTKELPVFITETGWAHMEGVNDDLSFLPADKVAENFKIAFEKVWLLDKRVRAVMPFTIKYNPPFDHFSWIKEDYKTFYPQAETIKNMPKIKGEAPMLIKGSYKVSDCE